MPRLDTKRGELERWLQQHRPARIGETEFAQIVAALAPVSVSYLRTLLRECGVPLSPMVEGVRQETFETLEASLLALLADYVVADRVRQRAVRRLVITARDHARLALARMKDDPGKRAFKEEVLLWMSTWLENPLVFGDWVRLRKQSNPDQGSDTL